MQTYKLQPKYFDLIKSGQKIYEIRLNDEKRQQLEVGDILEFKREPERLETINTIVKDLVYFKSFEEMANTLPMEKIGFSGESINEVLKIYYSFYTKEEEQKYGIVAIKIKVIK